MQNHSRLVWAYSKLSVSCGKKKKKKKDCTISIVAASAITIFQIQIGP